MIYDSVNMGILEADIQGLVGKSVAELEDLLLPDNVVNTRASQSRHSKMTLADILLGLRDAEHQHQFCIIIVWKQPLILNIELIGVLLRWPVCKTILQLHNIVPLDVESAVDFAEHNGDTIWADFP